MRWAARAACDIVEEEADEASGRPAGEGVSAESGGVVRRAGDDTVERRPGKEDGATAAVTGGVDFATPDAATGLSAGKVEVGEAAGAGEADAATGRRLYVGCEAGGAGLDAMARDGPDAAPTLARLTIGDEGARAIEGDWARPGDSEADG